MVLRPYTPADLEEILTLFYETVHTVNARDYTPAQLDAWTGPEPDRARWARTLQQHTSLVAVENGWILGFGDIDATGYLDRLYVHKDHQGQGVATALCDALEAAVDAPVLTTHASVTARPFFEARGYTVVRPQQVERQGGGHAQFCNGKAAVNAAMEPGNFRLEKFPGFFHHCCKETVLPFVSMGKGRFFHLRTRSFFHEDTADHRYLGPYRQRGGDLRHDTAPGIASPRP